MFFPCAQGFSKCSDGVGGGHPSISDDGNGNVVVAAGKDILLKRGQKVVFDSDTNNDCYIYAVADNDLRLTAGDANALRLQQSTITTYVNIVASKDLSVSDDLRLIAGTTVSITANGDTITHLSSRVKVSLDTARTLTSTPTISAGSDGQILILENTGAYALTLQDDSGLAGSALHFRGGNQKIINPGSHMQFVYSSSRGGWMQLGYEANV
jgi:hypothetical protein